MITGRINQIALLSLGVKPRETLAGLPKGSLLPVCSRSTNRATDTGTDSHNGSKRDDRQDEANSPIKTASFTTSFHRALPIG